MKLIKPINDADRYDCPNCKVNETPATVLSPWGLYYCSKQCMNKHEQKLRDDAEHERLAEISSGGQV